ncbi:hypothetical protein CC1G_07349 [Coprinopsis cinerea okayama7|uniref:Clathrin/coatomer adaptor adaptin-like N-terminal domain-containing protein n=1 Tax=Coprinopsis cinerea (strain Okayama-7 / 130 / ATCC MYA-4618 / FGSC 9003) TaxID=240176 RepID=A8N6H6_COPC7|nr:hypothetical protein CC1G_07349 [Coprinopsis cinerea okayama7\|eukprot:XP_001830434.2 hypothetical protein CC1G_07349 [Coprinopsis cinerea okayama7\
MDVPFSSSGALSRAHYNIVRKVETASTPQQADQLLALEIKTTHERLSKRSLTIKECKECLVILLYCASAATPGYLPHDTFDFGLTHALNLAAAGKSIEDRRIGYLYCTELMPADHELRLMMINTIRKVDLESGVVGRLCLALENLISMANEDIVPAVRDPLQILLSHPQGPVRRRAILAMRSLSTFDSQLLGHNAQLILKRLRDHDESVVSAALVASAGIPSSNPHFPKLRHVVNGMMSSIEPSAHDQASTPSLAVVQCLQALGMSEENIPFCIDLVKSASLARNPALVLGLCRLLSQQTPFSLIEAEKKCGMSLVRGLQDYLTSHNLNDQYVYLACLLGLDPDVWAGTSPDHPIVLEPWEVEKIMQYLDSPDTLLRRMTITLIAKIDQGIIAAYLSKCLEHLRPGLDLPTLNVLAIRLLDVVEVLTGDDGEKYAQGLKDLLDRLSSNGIMDRPRVLEGVVENVLLYIRASNHTFRVSCATTLLTYLIDSADDVGPTFLIICSALTMETIGATAVSPVELLQAFSSSLKTSSPIVQDTSLLTVLRLIAEVDESQATGALEVVTELERRSGRHIRKQVLELGSDPKALRDRIRASPSSTLPDFLEALERPLKPVQKPTTASSCPGSPSRSSPKLRYTAYEAPQAIPRLRHKRSSSAHGSVRSDSVSEKGLDRRRSQDVEALQLSLAAVSLGIKPDIPSQDRGSEAPGFPQDPPRSDLISLDSPFVSESDTQGDDLSVSEEFEGKWNGLGDDQGARGWCGTSVTAVLRRLQQLNGFRLKLLPGDIPPFFGELKVILENGGGETQQLVLVRMKESEDDSCLWRLKCADERLRKNVKKVLSDDD